MTAVEVSHLTKEYRLGALQGAKQAALNVGRRIMGKPVEERPLFKALDDMSFTIDEGEVVGIIGHNGAGKSTLLKMLARISTPTSGHVKVNGRLAPLIEVGAGFIPDFTGRENVYLNCSILGMSRREIDRKFDEIVDFAEMSAFIDTPVKRYSSGMQVKLAFAVATSTDSEVLIVDEVLAVGDLAFQRKCFDRIESLIGQKNKTVLVVSHNLRQIERLCQRVILIDRGRIQDDGEPRSVCNKMYEQMDQKIADQSAPVTSDDDRSLSDGNVRLLRVCLVGDDGKETDKVIMGGRATLKITYDVSRALKSPIFGVGIHTTDFVYLTTEQSYGSLDIEILQPGIHEVTFDILSMPLLPGVYSFRLGVADGGSGGAVFYKDNASHFKVTSLVASRAWNTSSDDGFFSLTAKWSINEK